MIEAKLLFVAGEIAVLGIVGVL